MLALGGSLFNSVRRRTLTMMETHLQYTFLDEYQKCQVRKYLLYLLYVNIVFIRFLFFID